MITTGVPGVAGEGAIVTPRRIHHKMGPLQPAYQVLDTNIRLHRIYIFTSPTESVTHRDQWVE